MALTDKATLEKKPNAVWTRELRLIETLRHASRVGAHFLTAQDITDLLAVLTAVDDYAKGITTAMDTVKTNYTTWTGK